MSTDTVETERIARMRAESGYELDDAPPPVRFSGFVSLLFGLLSTLSLLGRPLLLLPLLGIVFGLIALRPSDLGKPVGTFAARLGLLLAIGFGACGFFLPIAKQRTLGKQSEYFAQQYFELLKNGEWELVSELQRPYRGRNLQTMPLKEFYAVNEAAAKSLAELRENDALQSIARDKEADWQLMSSPRVFTRWGALKVETMWTDRSGGNSTPLMVEMEYTVDPVTDVGHWHVTLFQYYRERLVAESVL